MDYIQTIAHVAAGTAVVTNVIQYSMKTMIPLRVLGIVSNLLFLAYSTLLGLWPTIILNGILLPLNAYRLHEMRELIRRTQAAGTGDFDTTALAHFMSKRHVKANELLFQKGDVADAMYLVVAGRFQLPETGIEIEPGAMVGELGLLAPGGLRTQSLVALADGEIRVLPYERFEELYFQNPEFGLAFLKLSSRRLFQNIARLEAELSARTAEVQGLQQARPA